MRAFIAGISCWGPGLPGWFASRPVLRGEAPWQADEVPPPAPGLLAANERRRTSAVVRLALVVAEEAVAMSGLPAAGLHSVFGSGNGDGAVVHDILQSLATPGDDVSPTQFHNSVHNAAAGYWTIGAGTRQPASCIGCHDQTWAMALLKAMAEVEVEQMAVLLCVYDRPLPPPMAEKRPTGPGFGLALVLTPEAGAASLATLDVGHRGGPALPERLCPRLAALRPLAAGNPAAQGLRLLEALARAEPDSLAAPCLDGHVTIDIAPCSTAPAFCA